MTLVSISETIKLLQEAVAIANPGMEISISINMRSAEKTTYVKKDSEAVKQETNTEGQETNTEVDIDGIRLMLNGYAKAKGAEKAFALVEKYSSDGSRNPANVPPEKYLSMIKEIDKAEIDLSKQKVDPA